MDSTAFGVCCMVVRRHLNLLLKMPKAFSTTRPRPLIALVSIRFASGKLRLENGFVSHVLKEKASSPIIKLGIGLSSFGSGLLQENLW